MSDKTVTFSTLTQDMIALAEDQGHIGANAPVWGRFEGYTRVVLDGLKRRFAGTPFEAELDSIIKDR